MKQQLCALFLSAVMLLAAGTGCVTANETDRTVAEYDSLFEKDTIQDLYIEISDTDWQSILDNPSLEEYKSVTVKIGGETLENVGFRTKGNISLSSVARDSSSDRYSFRIKFDKYEKGQSLLGLDEMVVNNMYSDPSYLREYLAYEALKEIGCYTPQTVFTNLYINGELFGFYLGIEALDDSFLENSFGEDYKDGNFYKMEEGATLQYKENEEYTYAELKKGDDTDMTGLKEMIKTLNDMPDGQKGDIESILDIDSALRYIAGNTVLGNYDSYNGNQHHNYYLYQKPDGVFVVVPWDYNMAFGGFGGGGNQTSIPIDEPIASGSMESLPMIGKLLAVDEYKERYHAYIQELVSYLDGVEDRVAELSDRIRPYVQADPTKFVTMEQFEENIVYSQSSEASGTPDGGQMGTPPDGMTSPDAGQMGTPPDGIMPPNGTQMGTPPDGGEENTPRGKGGKGGFGGGGGMMTAKTSILTYAVDRRENVRQQLSGALPTTGNTYAKEQGGFGGRGERPQDGQGQKEQQDTIRVTVDGKEVSFEQPPVIENDRTLVPLRAIFEALGAEIEWDEDTQTVTARKDDNTIVLTIGADTATVNGVQVTLDVPGKLEAGRTLVPVRFIAQSMNQTVTWDEKSQLVKIESK
jgi:spore coat protein H